MHGAGQQRVEAIDKRCSCCFAFHMAAAIGGGKRQLRERKREREREGANVSECARECVKEGEAVRESTLNEE